jgi:AcrR family transcriptional regulator
VVELTTSFTPIVGLLSILTFLPFYDFLRFMTAVPIEQNLSRGHKKRERTHDQLIAAGLQVLADKGESLTISDVVARAQVSNGTFYNYFTDRNELIDALAEHSLISLAALAASETTDQDPARRFAVATGRVLKRAVEDPTWGQTVLRLTDHRWSFRHEIHRYLSEDLTAGLEQNRFAFGADEITLDLVVGLLTMSIRRIVRGDAGPGHVERVVERALMTLGVSKDEAEVLVAQALS